MDEEVVMGTELRDDADVKFECYETGDEMDIDFRNEKIARECLDELQKIDVDSILARR